MSDVEMPHPGHEQHLCLMENLGTMKSHFDDYKKLVKNAQYVCKLCGRVAASDKNLCEAEKL